MGRHRYYARLIVASASATVLAGSLSPPVFARDERAGASGSAEIVESVGTGIAYDVLTNALSSAFLTGRPGDYVSLLLPANGRNGAPGLGGASEPGVLLVLSTSTYRVDLGTDALTAAAQGSAVARNGPLTAREEQGNLLYLAQFN